METVGNSWIVLSYFGSQISSQSLNEVYIYQLQLKSATKCDFFFHIFLSIQKYPHLNVGFGGTKISSLKLQRWSSVSFVRVPTVSDWAKFAIQISKDEAPTPLLTVWLLFILVHLSRAHLATLKIHSVSQIQPNSEQRTSPEVVNHSGNEATNLARIPFLFA